MRNRWFILLAVVAMSSCSVTRSMRVAPVPDMQAAIFDSIAPTWQPLAKTLALEGKMLPVGGNSIEIFTDGKSKFKALNRDLESAEQYIDMEYYRFSPDSIGTVVRDILMNKAGEGVDVRMILESRTNAYKPSFYTPMKKSLDVLYVQKPSDLIGALWNVNNRDHRKIVVIDGKYCYTGGMNVSDHYYSDWRDTHLKIEGPIVGDFEKIFQDFWYHRGGTVTDQTKSTQATAKEHGVIVQSAAGYPRTKYKPVKEGFDCIFNSASEYLYIQTPYFCPPKSTIQALKDAAARGVDVRLMFPKVQDVPVMLWVNRYFYKRLLKGGVRIFERREPFIHSKSLVSDDYLSCYGSANLDNRSMYINYESNLYIYDKTTAVKGKEIFEEDLSQSDEITLEDTRWPLWERILHVLFITIGFPQW